MCNQDHFVCERTTSVWSLSQDTETKTSSSRHSTLPTSIEIKFKQRNWMKWIVIGLTFYDNNRKPTKLKNTYHPKLPSPFTRESVGAQNLWRTSPHFLLKMKRICWMQLWCTSTHTRRAHTHNSIKFHLTNRGDKCSVTYMTILKSMYDSLPNQSDTVASCKSKSSYSSEKKNVVIDKIWGWHLGTR